MLQPAERWHQALVLQLAERWHQALVLGQRNRCY